MIDSHLHCNFIDGQKELQLQQLKLELKKWNITKAVLYLIDERDYSEKNYLLDFGKSIIPAVMLDPRDADVDEKLSEIANQGIKMVKLLPYEQKLYYKDFDSVCEYALKLQKYGMILTVCGSYGSKDIYHTNGVELAAHILNRGFTNPLIIAHGGMVRQLDVDTLMCEFENLYIDISFTIPYWWGSHVIDDLHFVLKHYNYDRAFWGSDYPYYSFEEEIRYFDLFCEKYQINKKNKEKIQLGNFEKFYEEYIK